MITSTRDQYRMSDTRKPDGVHVVFRREEMTDCEGTPHFIGIRAVAIITLVRNGVSITHKLASAGQWGIESDSGAEYLEEVYRDEVCSLQDDMMFMADMLAMADKLAA